MLPCVPFRLNDEEKNLSDELQDIIKSISDIEKEVFVTLASPNWVIVPSVAYSLQFCYDYQMCYKITSFLHNELSSLEHHLNNRISHTKQWYLCHMCCQVTKLVEGVK
jgi:hypothetical protein